jgi:hypothetical protein
MPVKRRVDKRRISSDDERLAWAGFFDCGYDYFNDLPAIGVETDQYNRPDSETARAAWKVHGPTLAAGPFPRIKCGFALAEYGEPDAG